METAEYAQCQNTAGDVETLHVSEEVFMRLRSMEVALCYAGDAEAVAAVASTCPALVQGRPGQKTLFRAAMYGMAPVLKALLKAGADPNGPHSRHPDGSTPLHAAAYFGHTSSMATLLWGGADLTAKCSRGVTPLHAAALAGHVNCVRRLLSAGADFTATDLHGHYPVCYAVENGHEPVRRLLLTHAGVKDPHVKETRVHEVHIPEGSPNCSHVIQEMTSASELVNSRQITENHLPNNIPGPEWQTSFHTNI